MRKIILSMSVSLDGFFEGPDHRIDWHMVDDELHWHFNDESRRVDAFLCGRRTYELMHAFWPTADDDPESTAPMAEFADIWRDMPKLVFSRTLEHTDDPHASIVREFDVDHINALKAEDDGDLSLGGANLAASFIGHDLVDEYRLYVNPVILGQGTPLFPAATVPTHLRRTEARSFSNGVVLLRYERLG